MSEFLDELARAFATPMPRRRALRMLGGALVTVAVPGALRTQPALGSATRRGALARPSALLGGQRPSSALQFCEKTCSAPFPVPCICKNDRDGGPYAGCFETCGVAGSTCCCVKGSDGFNSGAVNCPPGTRCGRRGESNCMCINTCGDEYSCCGPDEFCATPRWRKCCKIGQRGCGRLCCNANEECRTIRVGTGSAEVCEQRCPPNRAWCGRSKCCPPRWHCINERTGLCKRCRQNEEECGNKCCDRRTSRCCGEAGCCPKNRSCCVNGTGPGGRQVCCPARHKCATPILPGNIGILPRTPAICCPPDRFHEDPKLCCPAGQIALRGPGIRVGPGLSPFCCPRSRACGSAANPTCCQTGLTGTETCCNGTCVDTQFDPRNCGRCGNVCASGVCGRGVCALP